MIAAELVDEHTNGPQYISSLVDATLVHLAKNYVTEDKEPVADQYQLSRLQLEEIRSFVADNVEDALSVADLANVAGVRLFEFPRAFRTTMGITPYQYILRERIAWSKELLVTTDLSLAEVSFAAGFSSQSHFNRTFRNQKSVTPLTYRHTFS